jgi:hypothetical protein
MIRNRKQNGGQLPISAGWPVLDRNRPSSLTNLVNFFTYKRFNLRKRILEGYDCLSRPWLIHRTVRRVHVMPWGTPVRRIGQILQGVPGDADHAAARA